MNFWKQSMVLFVRLVEFVFSNSFFVRFISLHVIKYNYKLTQQKLSYFIINKNLMNSEDAQKNNHEINNKSLEKSISSSDLDEDELESEKNIDYDLNEHIDCRDSVNKWLDAEVIGLRNNEIRVHFTGWSNKYDEWIEKNSDRVLKQWQKGMEFHLNNRLDVKDEMGKWLEARVIDVLQILLQSLKLFFKMSPSEIKVHFYNYSSKFDIWLEKNSGFLFRGSLF